MNKATNKPLKTVKATKVASHKATAVPTTGKISTEKPHEPAEQPVHIVDDPKIEALKGHRTGDYDVQPLVPEQEIAKHEQ